MLVSYSVINQAHVELTYCTNASMNEVSVNIKLVLFVQPGKLISHGKAHECNFILLKVMLHVICDGTLESMQMHRLSSISK